MKKLFSLLLVAVLTISLAAPAFAATGSSFSSGSSVSVGNSAGTGTSTQANSPRYSSRGPVFPTYKYMRGDGTMRKLPVKIAAFSTANKTVRIQIGNSTFYAPVTHKQSGSQTVSTISFEGKNRIMRYGFGSEHDTNYTNVEFVIVVKHFGSSVGSHTIYANANYSFCSDFKFQVWDKSVACANRSQSVTADNETFAAGTTSQGYFNSSFVLEASGQQVLSFTEVELANMNGRTLGCSHSGSSGPSLSGRMWLAY